MNDNPNISSTMEELDHPNRLLPISEFVDVFDNLPDRTFPSHWHPELELQIILEGRAEYIINGRSYLVEKGNGIYIAPEAIHVARALSPNTIGYDIVLLPQILTNLMTNANCEKYALPLTTKHPDTVVISAADKNGHRLLKSLKKVYNTEKTGFAYELLLLEQLLRIWRNLLSLMPKEGMSEEVAPQLPRAQRMKTMLEYIHKNYAENITVQDITETANISKSECFRCFAELSETTPTDYLNQYRLLQAVKLLLSGEDTVSEICYKTGFNNTSYFSKKFKEQYGMSPKEYRLKKHSPQYSFSCQPQN